MEDNLASTDELFEHFNEEEHPEGIVPNPEEHEALIRAVEVAEVCDPAIVSSEAYPAIMRSLADRKSTRLNSSHT